MLIRINRLFARVRRSDEGFTLVEVVVALVLFSVVTLGAIAAVGTITGMTADNRNREVAANLAQQAIDSSRVDARTDIMGMEDRTTYPVVDGTTYTVSRSVSWLTTQSIDSKCSTTLTTGTGSLLFRHINVTVKWPNMRASTAAVRSDTVFSPTSKINDPSAGTVLISVQSITGSGGVGGVTATLTPNSAVSPNTAQVIAGNAQPALTNNDGCTYATKVPPGAYTVTVSGPSGATYRDTKQQATSSQTVVVKAGDSAGATFTYDPAGDIQLAYASNYTGPSPVLPTDLTTTFVSTLDPYTTSTPSVDNPLSPLPSGYSVYAGKYSADTTSAASCRSVDPTQWPTANGRSGKAPAPVSATPGGTSTQPAQVAMGVVTINVKNTDKLVVAKTTTAQNGDPGCRAGMTYTFPRATTGSSGNTTMTIALPFGTWAIPSGTSATSQANITLGTLIGSIIGSVFGGSSSGQGSGQNVVILDPRS